MDLHTRNGADLYVNEGWQVSEYRVSPTERKEKSRFLTVSGSVCSWPF